jgi:hypothetical protein
MDLSKLTQGEKVIAGSGVALLIFSFLPWFEIGPFDNNGWDNFLSLLGILIGIAMVIVVLVQRFTTTQLPRLPVPWTQAMLIGGVASFVLVLLQFLVGDEISGVDMDRQFGLFLGLLASAGLAAGGYLRSREPADTTM